MSAENVLELELFNEIDPPPLTRIEVLLARMAAAICVRLQSGGTVEPKDFITDYIKLAEQALGEPKQRTPEDIAAEWRAMGFPVVIKQRGE